MPAKPERNWTINGKTLKIFGLTSKHTRRSTAHIDRLTAIDTRTNQQATRVEFTPRYAAALWKEGSLTAINFDHAVDAPAEYTRIVLRLGQRVVHVIIHGSVPAEPGFALYSAKGHRLNTTCSA